MKTKPVDELDSTRREVMKRGVGAASLGILGRATTLPVALTTAASTTAIGLSTGTAQAQQTAAPQSFDRFDGLANLPFEQNRPTPETAKKLMDELEFQQATQAYLWALPLINTLGMKFGSEKVFGVGYNILPVWKERLDPKTLPPIN